MPRIKFTTTSYEECKNDLIEFRNANRDTMRDGSYFDWRYLERPSEQKPIIVWAETEQGVKVGALSLIPHHFTINNKAAYVGLLGDISVAKEWRGKGIAQQMFKYLSETEAARQLSACLVLPNEAAARSLMKADWRVIATIDRYVKFINVEKRLRQSLRAPWLSRLVALPINLILRALSYETYTGDINGYKGAIIGEFDDRFDVLWNQAEKKEMIIGQRNRQYLTWRYSNHPLVHYQIFTVTYNSALCGYIVFHFSGDTCYIDDIFYLDKNKYPFKLLSYFLKNIRRTNVSKITLNRNNSDFFNLRLWPFGFTKRLSNWQLMAHLNDIKKDALLLNENKWFLTAGDKDA